MKKEFSWIDKQMKQAALLSEEEQDLSLWYYLSQLEPLSKENVHNSESNTVFIQQDVIESRLNSFPNSNDHLKLDETNYLEEDDGLSLNFDDYLEEEEFILNLEDYLDDEGYELKGAHYLNEELANSQVSADIETCDELQELKRVDYYSTLLTVKRYVSSFETRSNFSDLKKDMVSTKAIPLSVRSLIDFIGYQHYKVQFLSSYLSSYWKDFFTSSFSLYEFLKEWKGNIYITYHPHFSVQIGSEPITIDSECIDTMMKFEDLKIGVPLPALLFYTWRFTNAYKMSNQKRTVYLVGDRLDREEFNQLNQNQEKQIIIVGTDETNITSQKKRLAKIQNVQMVHSIYSLSFYELYSKWNILSYSSGDKVNQLNRRSIDIPVYFRMHLNNWAEKGETVEQLIDILSKVISDMCSDWWLDYSPEDIVVIKKIFEVSSCFLNNVIPESKNVYKKYYTILSNYKNQDSENKKKIFLQIERILLPIYEILNRT